MTLADFQPYVEEALIALEWATARARWKQGLLEEREALERAIRLPEDVREALGIELGPLQHRRASIDFALREEDVTADCVPQHPLRSVPMDLVTVAVVRRILRLPPEFPVLSIKALPTADDIAEAVQVIAMRWHTPNRASADEPTRITSHV